MANKEIRELRRSLEPTIRNLACRMFDVDPTAPERWPVFANIEAEAHAAAEFHIVDTYQKATGLEWTPALREIRDRVDWNKATNMTIEELRRAAFDLAAHRNARLGGEPDHQ